MFGLLALAALVASVPGGGAAPPIYDEWAAKPAAGDSHSNVSGSRGEDHVSATASADRSRADL